MLVGQIRELHPADIFSWTTVQTQVMSTSLALSDELYNVSQVTDMDCSVSKEVPESGKSFRCAVEELFQNITLSLVAFDRFRINFSDPTREYRLTNVTFSSPYILHNYTSRNLVVAYSTAAAIAASSVLVGPAVIFSAGRSYSSKFSTVMRTTGRLGAEKVVRPCDRDEKDPLPKHIADAKLEISEASSTPGYAEIAGDAGDVSLQTL